MVAGLPGARGTVAGLLGVPGTVAGSRDRRASVDSTLAARSSVGGGRLATVVVMSVAAVLLVAGSGCGGGSSGSGGYATPGGGGVSASGAHGGGSMGAATGSGNGARSDSASGSAGMTGSSTGGGAGTGGSGSVGPGAIGSPGCPDVSGAPLGVSMHPSEGALHTLNLCDPVCYGTLPPSSGTHYGIWPVYRTYYSPVPWGFMVHGLEHGAVELTYNCPDGCADEVAAAQAWIDSLPVDSTCPGLPPPRVILAPAPSLDVRWAAAAWQWTLRAPAFDIVTFQSFFDAHYNHGLEVICGDGLDLSSTGWCP